MLYPVYVHVGDSKHAHGVMFPDFPGCYAAADAWEALPAAVQEAVEAHFYEEPEVVPVPTALAILAKDPQYQGGVWLLADVDLSRLDTKPQRLNVNLPTRLVQRIDAWASAHHLMRSGFLAKAAIQAMRTT